MNTIAKSKDQVLKIVEKHVKAHQPEGYQLVVQSDGMRQDENWWYICVKPDRGGVRAHHYAELLTDIEDEIKEQEDMHVLLVPVLVGD